MTLFFRQKQSAHGKHLTYRYILAVFIIFLLSLSSLLALQYVVNKQDNYATVINISGRQRMLSQRTVMLLFHLYDIPKHETEHRQVTRRKLQESVDLMERSHTMLTTGVLEDGSLFTLSPAIADMYFAEPMHLDRLVTTHINTIKELVRTTIDFQTADQILHSAEGRLLSALNTVASQYEKESNSYMGLLKQIQRIVFLVTCAALLGIVYLLFRPMVRSVVENEATLNNILDDLPVYMDIVDEDLTVLYQSKYLVDALKMDGKGHKCYDIYKDDKQQCSNCPLLDKKRRKGSNIIHAEGCLGGRTLQVAHVHITFQGKPAILETFTDITEQQQTEQILIEAKETAERANKIKSEFLASMSHEIRTPINAIVGLVYLTLETKLSIKQKDYLKKISSSANQLLTLIDDLLDYSQIEAGAIQLKSVPFDLNDTMDNLASLVTFEALEQQLEVNFNIEPDVPTGLIGDQHRLEQVFTHLIQNSLKFTDAGYVDINTELLRQEQNHVTLRFSVSDSGNGVPENIEEYIFQPFSQGEEANIRKHGGTGMGLGLCKDLLELMGGTIQLEKKDSPGSLFTFTLDFAVSQRQQQDSSLELLGRKILIVDDHPMARKSLEYMLCGLGLEIHTVSSAEEAYTTLQTACGSQSAFDFVTLDFQMHGVNGIEAAKTIRQHPDLYGNPAIFLLTAYSKSQVVQHAEDLFDGLLLKPINRAVLMGSLIATQKSELQQTILNQGEDMPPSGSQLPGIDMARGLAQAGGNKKIYFSVLSKFLSNYASTVDDIRKALADNDTETSHRLLHTLKGVAGNIGAHKLHDTAQSLEDGRDVDDIEGDLRTLEKALQEVVTSIASLQQPQNTPVPSEENKNGTIDHSAILALTETITALLEESDTEVEQPIEKLTACLKNTSLSSYAQELENKVGRYEFDEALEVMEQLIRKMSGEAHG